jgi:hypothetical protein
VTQNRVLNAVNLGEVHSRSDDHNPTPVELMVKGPRLISITTPNCLRSLSEHNSVQLLNELPG